MVRLCPICQMSFDDGRITCPEHGARLVVIGQDDDPAANLIGKVIDGRFAVTALLGKGGMGCVYRARQLSMDREIALKLLHRSYASEPTAARRFLLEARHASRLNHPNIITIFEFGQTDTQELFLAMELLAGGTLGERIKEGPIGDLRRISAIVGQVCDGLHHAHEQGVIHRDLKPDNVFLISGAGRFGDFVKVLDFGIAKAAAVPGDESLTRSGMVCGTPAYMSPEQASGGAIDRRSDVYAIGVLLYELLAGVRPFTGDVPLQVMLAHVSQPPPQISSLRPDLAIPAEVERVVLRALSKDPAARPESALRLKMLLEEAMGGESRAEPATVSREAVVAVALPTDVDGIGVLETLGASGLAPVSSPVLVPVPVPVPVPADATPESTEAAHPRVPSGHRRRWAGAAAGALLLAGATVTAFILFPSTHQPAPSQAASSDVPGPRVAAAPPSSESPTPEPPAPVPPTRDSLRSGPPVEARAPLPRRDEEPPVRSAQARLDEGHDPLPPLARPVQLPARRPKGSAQIGGGEKSDMPFIIR